MSKKIIISAVKVIILLFTFHFSLFTLTSCSDDTTTGGQPVITSVRKCDPTKADSTFVKSSQGQIIAIIGKNLDNTVYVYINDQKVYFNPTMNTDHSIIVTVPTETKGFKLTAFNDDLKDEIRVETTHGTATYDFKVLGQYPTISRVQCEYPRKAGDVLNVYGVNLEQIEKMYFTDLTPEEIMTSEEETVGGNHVDVSDYKFIVNDHHLNSKTQAYETTSQLEVTIPELPYDRGSFVIECAAGVTYIAYGKTPGMPVITYITSDMPEVGEDVTIRGREFVQVESVKYGDVEVSNYTVAESEDAITFTFEDIPAIGSDATLSITTPGGTVVTSFYDRSSLLVDFDGIGADNGWDPKASTESVVSGEAPYTSTGMFGRINVPSEIGSQWWGTMIFYRGGWDDAGNLIPFTMPENIPADAKAEDVYFAMEVFDNNSDYNNDGTGFSGYLRYVLFPNGADTGASDQDAWSFNNFQWEDYEAGLWSNLVPILADDNNEAHKGKWYRHVVSLEKFPCFAGLNYATIKSMGLDQFRIQSINQHNKGGKIDVCFDNIRLIYLPK